MPNYNSIITAEDLGNGGTLPVEYATEVIQGAPKSSVMLNRARHVTMSSRTRSQPVLDSLPLAYWVTGDTGLKQTTEQKWGGLNIVAEEAAAIVPIPESIIEDSSIDLWGEVRPRLSEGLGRLVDSACLFGVDKPASFPTCVVEAATTAGNVVQDGTGSDLGVDVATLAAKIARQGFNVNGFAAQPGLNWELAALRDADGRPIYTRDMQTAGSGMLLGYGLNEVDNGSWDAGKARLIMADWSNFIVGVRKDISYKLLDQAVISDADGKVVLNLAQQDCLALRVTFRVGFQVANPVTALQGDKSKRYPAGVVTPKTVAAAASEGK